MASPARIEQASSQLPKFSLSEPGERARSFNRFSVFLDHTITTPQQYIDIVNKTHQKKAHELGPTGRTMVRALTTDPVRYSLLNGMREHLPGEIETAIPIKIDEHKKVWIVETAYNGEERIGSKTRHEIRNTIDSLHAKPRSAGDSVEYAAQNYDLVTRIPSGMEESLHELWGETFGWSLDGIKKLQERLEERHEPGFPAEARTVFFAGVVNRIEKEFGAASMVETLTLKGPNGKDVIVAEETEWNARPKDRGKGAAPASVAASLSQVVDAFDGKIPYAVYAECNDAAPANKPDVPSAPLVGLKVGMDVPRINFADRTPVSQVLLQNVGVNDGQPVEPGNTMEEEGRIFPMRNFVVLQLLPDNIDMLYDQNERRRVREIVKR